MMISEPTPFSHPFNFNDIQRVHPLSASPGGGSSTSSSAFFRATSPIQSIANNSLSNSITMINSNSNNGSMDDVTTIFVVGFPEDMAEREFQNMFTFCPGFEAASLKWHCKDQDDEISINNNNNNNNNNNGGKKQMIGFARFRTRLEALEAIEVLGGKKVDQDKGTVLKAEMAKKNLHIKRGSATQPTTTAGGAAATATTSTSSTSSSTSTSTSLLQANNNNNININSSASSNSLIDSNNNKLNSRYDAFSPLPSDLLSPQDYKADLFMDQHQHHPISSSLASPSFSESFFGLRSQSFSTDQDFGGFMNRPFPVGNGAPVIPPPPPSSSASSRLKSLEDNSHIMDPYHYLSKSSPVPNDSINNINNHSFFMHHSRYDSSININNNNNHHHHQQQQHLPQQHQHQHNNSIHNNNNNNNNSSSSLLDQDLMRMSSLSILTNTTNSSSNASNLDLRSPTSMTSPIRMMMMTNPADQNPPCNTLYVGNLPPNTSEDELRQVFSVCKGYRRMCFRTKPQGPMCFVEFEDIVYASNALAELQGHNLTNSVKGGIRLSYSKNPLFIKPTAATNGQTKEGSFKQMGNVLMNGGSRDFVFDPQL